MNNFLERLKTDRILQLIVAGLLVMIIILTFIFRGMFSSSKKSQAPCYNTTLKIWLPFKEDEFYPYLSNFAKFCVHFEVETKSLEEIKNNLTFALATNQYPDVVFIDNEFLNKYPDFFATPTPILADSLIAYYNQDILNFFNLEKPKTLEDIKNLIQKIKNYKQDFYPVGLGTKDIKNRKEIILSLMSLTPDYKNKEKFKENFVSALKIYKNFSNPESEFFSYPKEAGEDLTNFANEKTALYIGFYSDKKEILSLNPRINLSFGTYPLNTFPPKTKIYSKIFYLAPLKKSKNPAKQDFISWFSKYQLKKFAKDFDLVPFVDDQSLPTEKKLIYDSVKNFGETFDFLNKEILFDNIDRILEANEDESYRIIEEIYYSL